MLLDFWSLFCCDLVPTRLALGTLLFMVAATAMHGGMQPCPLLSPSPARARVSTHFATTTCKNLGQADPKGCIFFPSLFTNHQNCYACNSWGLPALLRKQQVTHWRAQLCPRIFGSLRRSSAQPLLLPLITWCRQSQLRALHRLFLASPAVLPPPPLPGISLQVIWGYGHSSENMMMKHLCFDYTLSSPAGFNVLCIPVWLLFLCCLSFIELVNANHFWDVINFPPADKTSVRQEGARSLLWVLWASNFTCSLQLFLQ